MDTYRSLYKANPISPKKCKRKEAHEIRANKRSELYTSTRNISPSRSPLKKHCIPLEEQKENLKPPSSSEAEKLPEFIKPGFPNTKINEKLNRQKAHLLKFLAWKAEKAKNAQIKEKSKRAPFIVGTRICAGATQEFSNINKKPSFAPSNHIFRPPPALQSLEFKVIDSNSLRLINGTREETYHFLATPNKENKKTESAVSSLLKPLIKPMSHKTLVGNTRGAKPQINHKPTTETEVRGSLEDRPPKNKANPTLLKATLKSSLPPIKKSNFKAPKTSNSSISSAFMKRNIRGEAAFSKLNGKSVLQNMPEAGKPVKQIYKTPTSTSQGPLMKPTSKEPSSNALYAKEVHQVEKTVTRSEKDIKQIVVPSATKVNLVSDKALGISAKVTKTPLKAKLIVDTKINVNDPKNAKGSLALSRQKSVMPPIKRLAFKASKKSNSSISNAFISVTGNNPLRCGPPKVKLNGKSIRNTLAEAAKSSENIPETPTDTNQEFPFLNVVTSTKLKSLSSKESNANTLFVEMAKLVSPVDDLAIHPADGEKFNFLRYSVVQSEATEPQNEVKAKVNDDAHVTPEKTNGSQTPTTYLSPFVSVSRGKVGIKMERQKRNSVYLSVDKSMNEDADTTAKARHTMATVHYYRKQLKDEIDRLNSECNDWQQYKEENAQLLEDVGSDMINVTIGQTKLLTTKKLKQFGDLIDRCENGAMGKKALGKGDGAKPILTEDLEGFWSMVGLQIENVDKRFGNLKRWRDNNWKDPEEVPVKSTHSNNKLRKTKKPKQASNAGPNRDLQKILKNAQAAFLRKKTANNAIDEDVILTPSKSRQVLIRDRRSRSAAATVITINTPKISRKSYVFDQTASTDIDADTKVLPHINGFRKSMNLFKSALLNNHEKTSPGANTNSYTSPLPVSRKSILKTPGSVRPPKNVIFNSPTLQFTVEDSVENEKPSRSMSPSYEDHKAEEERTYSLRTRSIKLRDLADIVIPE